jgi:Integrase core domain
MIHRENCWGNAVAESFYLSSLSTSYGILKTELTHPEEFANHAIARMMSAVWIEVFYNRQRLHSMIRYISPVHFEKLYWVRLSKQNAEYQNCLLNWGKIKTAFPIYLVWLAAILRENSLAKTADLTSEATFATSYRAKPNLAGSL